MKRRTLLVLTMTAALSGAGRLWGETYLGVREFGDAVCGAGARSVAMGSTGLARARQAAVFRMNPAVLNDLEKREISVTPGPVFVTEKFVEASSETRFRNQEELQINEVTVALPLKSNRLWFAVGASPAYDFNYEEAYTLYSSTGSPSSDIRLKDSGVLWAVTPAISVGLSDTFSLGVAYDFWTGQEKLGVTRFQYNAAYAVDSHEKADYSGGAARVGFRWKASDKFSFGAMYQPSGKLTRDFDFINSTAPEKNRSGSDTWDMPAQWGFGISYFLEGEHATEAVMEVRQTLWGAVKVDGQKVNKLAATKPIFQETSGYMFSGAGAVPLAPRSYSDVTEIRVGVEHTLTEQWQIRFGFHHLPYFADRTVEATYFTGGAGFQPNESWAWSLAGEFGKRDFKGENLFFDVTRRVDETFRRFLLTGSFRW
ncbi:MAG TPA: hypothetical protein P5079_07095 [Elusimicrobiota bacterium]|nr:hypothetical protein [Elusimicrobiota bacterium]